MFRRRRRHRTGIGRATVDSIRAIGLTSIRMPPDPTRTATATRIRAITPATRRGITATRRRAFTSAAAIGAAADTTAVGAGEGVATGTAATGAANGKQLKVDEKARGLTLAFFRLSSGELRGTPDAADSSYSRLRSLL